VVRVVLAAAVAGLLLGACGNGDCSCSPGPGTTPVALAPGFDVMVTDRDRAVSVTVGQHVEVALAQHSGMTLWGPVRADDASVLGSAPIGVAPPRGYTIAGFVALKAGTTAVTSTAGAACSPGQACPQFAELFSVAVTVS